MIIESIRELVLNDGISYLMYAQYGIYARVIKRCLVAALACAGLDCVITIMLLVLIIIGAIVMEGNPFFIQERPGKDERIFQTG